MRPFGFSTGAVALGDFETALEILGRHRLEAVELSALRAAELPVLVRALDALDLAAYSHVSIHAPSSYAPEDETGIVTALTGTVHEIPIVVHPDAIQDIDRWSELRDRVLIENMDRRKPRGRTADDLTAFFGALPEAGLCFDVGHARQVDSSMTEAHRILDAWGDRLRELHVSSVGSDSRHYRLDYPNFLACRELADRIPEQVPIILEGRVGSSEVEAELGRARDAFAPIAVRTRYAVASG